MLQAPSEREVQIWWTRLPPEDEDLAPQHTVLAVDEQARAARFKVEPARRCFIVAHAFLRTVLGEYLHTHPPELRFRYGPNGKPYLEEPQSRLQFNLSHSADLVVLGLSRSTELGVDVEMLRPMPRAERLADRFFSPTEAARVAALEGDDRLRTFFHLWTAKEAYLKAVGTGITEPLREVVVGASVEQPYLRALGSDVEAAAAWSLLRPESPPGSIITVAIPGTGWSVTSLQWSAKGD